MSKMNKFFRIMGSDGVGGLIRYAKSKVKGRSTGCNAYQDKTGAKIDARWNQFREQLPTTGSLVDLGCNLGEFTERAAARGLLSLGIEMDTDCVNRARLKTAGIQGLAFMEAEVNEALCHALPTFDVVLVLSVHHNWHSVYSPETCKAMLQTLLSKTRDVMIFEGPSRNERFYSNGTPGFIDNDEASVVSYYTDYLRKTFGDMAHVTLLGGAPSVGEREPLRWMFSVRPT